MIKILGTIRSQKQSWGGYKYYYIIILLKHLTVYVKLIQMLGKELINLVLKLL